LRRRFPRRDRPFRQFRQELSDPTDQGMPERAELLRMHIERRGTPVRGW
jgi:hypothetical protein